MPDANEYRLDFHAPVLDPFQLAFVQRGVLEVLLLSTAAGLLGTWIVLRGLAFFTHAAGTAAFPGLVVADGVGFSPHAGAAAAVAVFALGVERLARRTRSSYDTLTALVLVAALAAGVILASDVFHFGADVDSLLFGSLLAIGSSDLVLAALVSLAALAVVATSVVDYNAIVRGVIITIITCVLIVSVDGGCKPGLELVSSGVIGATAQQYPGKMASLGVESIAKLANGGAKPTTSNGLSFFNTGTNLVAKDALAGVTSQSPDEAAKACWGSG
jgi:hypothetical protein